MCGISKQPTLVKTERRRDELPIGIPTKVLVSQKRDVNITLLDTRSSRKAVGDVGPDHIQGTSSWVSDSGDLHWVREIGGLEGLVEWPRAR